jgi:hypothetical protein
VPFTVEHENGETLVFEDSFHLKKGADPFAFALSSRATYLPRKKRFAMKDPWYFERVPISQIREVSIERMRPYLLWLLALLFIVVGGVTSYWMMQSEHRDQGGMVSGLPFGILAIGLALPFVARGRRCLVVSMVEDRFVWKESLVLDRKSRTRIRGIQDGIATAFEHLHVPVRVE